MKIRLVSKYAVLYYKLGADFLAILKSCVGLQRASAGDGKH